MRWAVALLRTRQCLHRRVLPRLLGTYLADLATSQLSHTITKDSAVCRCRTSLPNKIFGLRLYVKIHRAALNPNFNHTSKR